MDEYMLNDLLECSVCLERLDTSSRVLPCQHTFCKKCLEEIVSTKKELRCPECRVLVNIKIDELPPNVLLMRILGGMKSTQPKGRNTSSIATRPMQALPVQQVAAVPTNHGAANLAADITRVQSAPKQTLLPNQPYARAVYDYLSNEPGDLKFKKGDIIMLRKKMDANWYHGECGGSHGVFPLTYVQVITPLPSHIPQCKALYDFRMTNDDEEGCLTFNKGEVITVIRRVDENWAEGKLTDRIGIFPLAFVELNNIARALMKLSTNSQPGPSRLAPPTPTSEDTTPLIPTDHSRTVHHHITMGGASDSSSTPSSSTTTPNTSSSNTSSSSSTAPSSPASPPPPRPAVGCVPPPRPAHMSPPLQQARGKRHSFSNAPAGTQHPPSHRHSAEILPPTEPNAAESSGLEQPQSEGLERQGSQRHRRSGSTDSPAAYIALYAYKPQKADEMELRKGGIYMVTERCQDGWFKGTSSRTQKGGVFPGNYVAPAKAVPGGVQAQLRGLTRPNTAPGQSSPRSNGSAAQLEPLTAVSYTRSGAKQMASPRQLSSQPPELPPRATSPHVAPISALWHEGAAPTPLGRSQSAVMAPPNVTVSPRPLPTEKTKSKDKSGVSLMRRLTSIKKSKSPPPMSTYSMDNPVFESGNLSVTIVSSPSHPVHVRSGSCPSQLLQALPLDGSTPHHRLFANASGSQRLKHKGERPSVHCAARLSEPITAATASSNGVAIAHRKSNSLDAGSGEAARKQAKPVPAPVRERFRCIVPYPPNSEYELELRVGDIIYVHKKREDGWYKGTQQRTGRTGLFPASFVEAF